MSDMRQDQLALFSALFVRTDEATYAQLTAPDSWAALAARDSALALGQPPSFDAYRHFMNTMLTPGVPGALPPVESLYKDWGGHRAGLQHGQGYYLGDAAQHVRAVCEGLKIQVPDAFQAMPDHLVLLLELFEYLRVHAPAQDAADFAAHHFDWLGTYRDVLADRAGQRDDAALEEAAASYGQVLACIEKFVFAGVREARMREGHSLSEERSAEEVVLQ